MIYNQKMNPGSKQPTPVFSISKIDPPEEVKKTIRAEVLPDKVTQVMIGGDQIELCAMLVAVMLESHEVRRVIIASANYYEKEILKKADQKKDVKENAELTVFAYVDTEIISQFENYATQTGCKWNPDGVKNVFKNQRLYVLQVVSADSAYNLGVWVTDKQQNTRIAKQ